MSKATYRQIDGSTHQAISLIMPTIDWGSTFRLCLEAAAANLGPDDQLVVVFDGVLPARDWQAPGGVTFLSTTRRGGPGAARNLGAKEASNGILMFVDADVELHRDAVPRIKTHFANDPQLTAVFGSYDAYPVAPGLASRFRNLLHHHTHSSHPGPATTFWAGCGAVRRDAFLAVGGFDASSYQRPCIEDIDLGQRLHQAGGTILLDPAIQGSHHKRWSLGLMIRTDIQHRALPWSRMLLRRGQHSTTLNLDPTARWSTILSLLTVALTMALPWFHQLWPLPLLTLALIITLNRSFYRLCWQRGGPALGLTSIGLHCLYFIYSSLTFAYVIVEQMIRSTSSNPSQ
jgi:GT2 family glycosyltransferase